MTTAQRTGAIAISVVWGLCFVLIQAQLPSPTPLFLAAARALLGATVLVGWLAVRRRRPRGDAATPARRLPPPGPLIAMAVLNITLALGAMYLAAGRSEAAVAAVLTGGQPVMLALGGWLLLAERPSRRVTAGLLLASVGLALTASAATGATSVDGVFLALLAALAPAIGTVLVRRLAMPVDMEWTTAAQLTMGGLLLLGLSRISEPWGSVSWGWATLGSVVVLGVVGTGVAYAVWFRLARVVPLARLGPMLYLVPVVGFAAGLVVGNRPAQIELLGMAGLLAGIVITSTERPSRARAL